MKHRVLISLFILASLLSQITRAQDEVLLGGKIGAAVPLNLFNKDNAIGFHNVAKKGVLLGFTGKWFYGKRLSLGAEGTYQYNPPNMEFWSVERYGEVDVKYQSASILLNGNYYFSHKELRPYCGIAFGAYYLFNQLQFSSAYTGTDADQSINYKTQLWKPGFAPEAGILFELSKKSYLELSARMVFIPNIEEDYETQIIDGWPVVINKNPHGNQHHLQFSVALFFEK